MERVRKSVWKIIRAITLQGIFAEIVIPTLRPRYIFAAAIARLNNRPRTTARKVNSLLFFIGIFHRHGFRPSLPVFWSKSKKFKIAKNYPERKGFPSVITIGCFSFCISLKASDCFILILFLTMPRHPNIYQFVRFFWDRMILHEFAQPIGFLKRYRPIERRFHLEGIPL